MREGALGLGLQLLVLKAGAADEIDAAFEKLAREGASAVIIGSDPLRASQFVVLTARHGLACRRSDQLRKQRSRCQARAAGTSR